MKIVFMGTPDFAVLPLKAIVEAGHDVRAVFTQPDKPKNRGHKMQPTPVKEYAVEQNIPVYQPLSLKKGDDAVAALKTLSEINPDVIVVAAYGKILPKELLELPKFGCINIHASLLPKYRGAAPIQWSIINGEKESGITIMQMADGIDTGDMMLKESVQFDEKTTYSILHDQLAEIGASLIVQALKLIENGESKFVKQDDSQSTHAPMITKELCKIDFTKPAIEVQNLIKGLSATPCAYTILNGKRLKIYFAEVVDSTFELPAGTIADTEKFVIVCGDKKGLIPTEVQLEGGKRMCTEVFLRGTKLEKIIL